MRAGQDASSCNVYQVSETCVSAAAAAEVAVEATLQARRADAELRAARRELSECQAQMRDRHWLQSSSKSALENARLRYQSQEAAQAARKEIDRSRALEQSMAARNQESEQQVASATQQFGAMQARLDEAIGEAQEAAKETRQLRTELDELAVERAADVFSAEAAANRAAQRAQNLQADLIRLRKEAESLPINPSTAAAAAVRKAIGPNLLDCEAWVELSVTRSQSRLLREELQQAQRNAKVQNVCVGAEAAKKVLGQVVDASHGAVGGLREHAGQLRYIFDRERLPDSDVVAETWKFVKAVQAANSCWSTARAGTGNGKAMTAKVPVVSRSENKGWPAILAAAECAGTRVAALRLHLQQ